MYLKDCLVLTELILEIGQLKEFRKLTFKCQLFVRVNRAVKGNVWYVKDIIYKSDLTKKFPCHQ